MATIEDSVDVNAPVSDVYTYWSHFEEFPRFMEGIEKVHRLEPNRYHWCANVAGKDEEWDAEVTENIPDARIAWRSISGRRNDGLVEFEPLSAGSTRVYVKMEYEPSGMVEKVGDLIGMDQRRVHSDLEHFKQYVEQGRTVH